MPISLTKQERRTLTVLLMLLALGMLGYALFA